MGLGKTMQVLALLLLRRRREPDLPPALLAAPASLLSNWLQEARRFAPSLRVAVFHPSETRPDTLARWARDPGLLFGSYDLVIISYALVARHLEALQSREWGLVILDEAQAIKNPGTAQSRAVRRIPGRGRIALTGTPIENNLIDLWSIFDFLNPGLLGSLGKFHGTIRRLGEEGGPSAYAPIRRLVGPYLLRRLKTDRRVIDDLPDKTEQTLHCHLTGDQASLYTAVVRDMERTLTSLSADGGAAAGGRGNPGLARSAMVLKSLQRLKQVINHPAQLTGDRDWRPERSGKFMRLAELCREMAERQERLLVFTQYREIIPALEEHLTSVFGARGLALHGGTGVSMRRMLVESFQREDGPPFFILSLKAGGVGLNLTRAGQVIHFDRWWNPAVEDQATDRAFRIGQKKNVLVHKCVTIGTLEERIDGLLRDKRRLASDILSGDGEMSLVDMDDEELLRLVSLDLDRAVLS
jgi:non-specific serine/threonine protein kinase